MDRIVISGRKRKGDDLVRAERVVAAEAMPDHEGFLESPQLLSHWPPGE
jgi:hypothetical protein